MKRLSSTGRPILDRDTHDSTGKCRRWGHLRAHDGPISLVDDGPKYEPRDLRSTILAMSPRPHDMREKSFTPDGNSMFRAVAWNFGLEPEHQHLREEVVARARDAFHSGYLDGIPEGLSADTWLREMARQGVEGDRMAAIMVTDIIGIPVVVWHSVRDEAPVVLAPHGMEWHHVPTTGCLHLLLHETAMPAPSGPRYVRHFSLLVSTATWAGPQPNPSALATSGDEASPTAAPADTTCVRGSTPQGNVGDRPMVRRVPRRGGFRNEGNTCFLAALVQGFLACPPLVAAADACHDAAFIALRRSNQLSCGGGTSSLGHWRQIVDAWPDMAWGQQHSVHEAFVCLTQNAAMMQAMHVDTRQHVHTEYDCRCNGPNPTTSIVDEVHTHVPLEIDADSPFASVAVGFRRRAAGEEIDNRHCEHCRAPARRCCRRFEDNVVSSTFVVSIQRHSHLRKCRSRVVTDETLRLGARSWRLAAVIVHRGESIHGGHYVAYTRHDSTFLLFDDAHVSACDVLPDEVYTDAVLCFYVRADDAPREEPDDAKHSDDNRAEDGDHAGHPGDGRGHSLNPRTRGRASSSLDHTMPAHMLGKMPSLGFVNALDMIRLTKIMNKEKEKGE